MARCVAVCAIKGKSLLPLVQGKDSGRDKVYSITDPWMPNPQFAVRTESWKWIAQKSRNLIYNVATDPKEEKEINTIPEELNGSKDGYKTLIGSLKKHQEQVATPRVISDEECQRLQALGYMTCQKPK